jgi:chaperone required for assembly of F1-ATPase
MFCAQPEPTLDAVRDEVVAVGGPLALAALHVMTTLTGSVVLALAVAHGRAAPAEAWAAAHLDEDFQMEVWGEDEEALQRRAARHRDFEAAAALHRAVRGG